MRFRTAAFCSGVQPEYLAAAAGTSACNLRRTEGEYSCGSCSTSKQTTMFLARPSALGAGAGGEAVFVHDVNESSAAVIAPTRSRLAAPSKTLPMVGEGCRLHQRCAVDG